MGLSAGMAEELDQNPGNLFCLFFPQVSYTTVLWSSLNMFSDNLNEAATGFLSLVIKEA